MARQTGGQRNGWPEHTLLWVMLVIGFVLVLMPVGAMFFGSVQSSLIGAEREFTTHALERVYTTAPYLLTLAGTLGLSVAVALIAAVLGGLFAWLINRTDLPGRRWLELVVIAPLFLSPFVGAVAWITLAAPNSGILNVAARQFFGIEEPIVNVMTLPGIIWVLALYYAPYGYLFVSAALKNMDPSLEEASSLNGAGLWRTLRKVTFPLSWPSVASAFFLIAVLAMGVFSVPAVLGVRVDFVPLAVRLFRAVGGFPADYAVAAAIGTMMFWFTLAGIWMYRRSIRLGHRYVTVSARGYRPRMVPLGAMRWVAAAGCVAYGLVAVVLPYLALTLVALSPFIQTDLTQLRLGFDNIIAVATSRNVVNALTNTIIIGVAAPTICAFLGLLSSYSVTRVKARGSALLDYIATLPIAIPGIVFATGMVWMYIRTPLYATISILVIAYVASYLPHSLRLTSNGLMQIDNSLEEASTMCGAPRSRTIRKVTLPLSKPAVLSAWVLAFIFTVREINSAIVLYSPRSNVLSVMTWNFIQDGRVGRAAVVGLMQTVLLLLGIVLARFVLRVKLTSTGGVE